MSDETSEEPYQRDTPHTPPACRAQSMRRRGCLGGSRLLRRVLRSARSTPAAPTGTAYDDFLREYVLMVDETPVSIRLLYDWGSWCFLVCSVQVLEADADISLESGLDAPDPSSEGGRKRGRGGSL